MEQERKSVPAEGGFASELKTKKEGRTKVKKESEEKE